MHDSTGTLGHSRKLIAGLAENRLSQIHRQDLLTIRRSTRKDPLSRFLQNQWIFKACDPPISLLPRHSDAEQDEENHIRNRTHQRKPRIRCRRRNQHGHCSYTTRWSSCSAEYREAEENAVGTDRYVHGAFRG